MLSRMHKCSWCCVGSQIKLTLQSILVRAQVHSVYSPLTSEVNVESPAPQQPLGTLARWAQSLCEFDLELRYRPGRVNSNADALSRAPVDGSNKQDDGTEVQVAQVSAIHVLWMTWRN